MKNSDRLSPVIPIIAILLILIRLSLFAFIGLRFIPIGGEKSIDNLMLSFQSSVNNADENEYISLVPLSERSNKEISYVKENLARYSGKHYTFKAYDTKKTSFSIVDTMKLYRMSPLFAPAIYEKYTVSVVVSDSEKDYDMSLMVYKINGRYYLDDVNK